MTNKFNCSMQKKIESLAKKSEGIEDDAIQMFKDVAKACGVSDRVTVSANNGKIYFTLRLTLDGLDEYVFEYDPTTQFIRCVATATGDSSTGSRKKFNSLDDASDWLKENVEALLDTEKEAKELLGLSEGLEDHPEKVQKMNKKMESTSYDEVRAFIEQTGCIDAIADCLTKMCMYAKENAINKGLHNLQGNHIYTTYLNDVLENAFVSEYNNSIEEHITDCISDFVKQEVPPKSN